MFSFGKSATVFPRSQAPAWEQEDAFGGFQKEYLTAEIKPVNIQHLSFYILTAVIICAF